MGFWKSVVEELEFQGKTRKWLAAETEIDVSTIGTGLKRDGMPSADIAIKVANALNVSVEYLVLGEEQNANKNLGVFQISHKYLRTLRELDSIPEEMRRPIIDMIHNQSQASKALYALNTELHFQRLAEND